MKLYIPFFNTATFIVLTCLWAVLGCDTKEPAATNYTVTFNVNEGSEVPAQQVKSGGKATKPTNPTKTGYAFGGWYSDPATTQPYNFDNPVTAAITLYAKWNEIYTVTFDLNYEGAPAPQTQAVADGSTATVPNPAPEREDYTFGGWYSDPATTQPYNFDNPVTAAITLYAKWNEIYTVTFDLNYEGAPAPQTQAVADGSTATVPDPAPEREDYTFGGWYSDPATTQPYNFEGSVTAAITLYVKWNEIYTVTFDLNYEGAPAPPTQAVADGSSATAPDPAPEREGYAFGGWYSDPATTQPYNFEGSVTAAITLYAKWNEIYTVTFDLNYEGAPAPPTQAVADGSSAAAPDPTPEREGYALDTSWYTVAESQTVATQFDFDTPIAADVTLYAKWNEIYTLTFDLNYEGAPAPPTQAVADGSSATAPDLAPEREDYAFGGWYSDPATTQPYNFEGSVTAAITLYAKWNEIYTVTFDLNYEGAPAPPTQAVADGATATAPDPAPEREDYALDTSWYTVAESQTVATQFDFDTPIAADVTLYAKWNKIHTVTFDFNYEGAPAPQTQAVVNGATATAPDPFPDRGDSHQFCEWGTSQGTNSGTFYLSGQITQDITLYAKWASKITGTIIVGANNNSLNVKDNSTGGTFLTDARIVDLNIEETDIPYIRWRLEAVEGSPFLPLGTIGIDAVTGTITVSGPPTLLYSGAVKIVVQYRPGGRDPNDRCGGFFIFGETEGTFNVTVERAGAEGDYPGVPGIALAPGDDATTKIVATVTAPASFGTTGELFRYILDVSTDPDFPADKVERISLGTSTERTVDGLTPGTTYYFRVLVQNNSREPVFGSIIGSFLTPSEVKSLATQP